MKMLVANAKPWKAVSKDQSRPILTETWLTLDPEVKGQPRTGAVAATDSFVLVAVPVEFDEDDDPTEGHLPAKALAECKRYGPIVKADTVRVPETGTDHPRRDIGQFPRWQQLMPDEAHVSDFKVGINAKLLAKLADALGSEQVVLEFCVSPAAQQTAHVDGRDYVLPSNIRVIRVRPLGGKSVGGPGASVIDGAIGIAMPIRLAG